MGKYYQSYQMYEAWVGKKWRGGKCKLLAVNSFDEAVSMAQKWATNLEGSPPLTQVKKIFDEVVYDYNPNDCEDCDNEDHSH